MGKTAKQQQGDAFEAQAVRMLLEQGYQIITTKYLAPRVGEIDIIATCQVLERGVPIPCVVFVEVRSRRRSDFGSALDSITPAKQAKIYRTAEQFLLGHPQYAHAACRFDVVVFELSDAAVLPEWIQSAF